MGGPWRLLRALRLRLLGPEKQFVDSDPFGNKYYKIPKHQTWAAWIRKRRKDPPTMEEILKNKIYREEIKVKITGASEKDSLLQTKEYEGLVAEPVQTQIKGHASSPYYGKNEPSPDPSSTAKTFQPGSWVPPDSSSRNK
ncbi:NADH dehydrogenase [ubiquinone] 1 alpha subcomplex assembly factor 2 isoform X2 [Malaclemys terrapin pileata]|uniref:NADH dehydrogenase [ubiquinone] 1 alpha subcomplex assembly factor 2 isoform X2 n=1 Tax=Malaclemys terrapin pileata TaxID=2991368 RepID=UPI0023A88585|nr:NADH dehydrogenase [ubiquinone] 1 alpha subcomplex assembly factor 2 isoform X2 [Malaclemys terrapin pileata]